MSPEKQQTLYDKYPRLFERHNLPANETCMCWGIATGDGWYNLIDRTCQKILDYCKDKNIEVPQFDQVKEKFGGLRMYFNDKVGGDIHDIVSEAEDESFRTCEESGREGHMYNCNGWFRVLAEDLAEAKNYIKCKNAN